VNIFLGITGASGAPYARRLLQALAEAGAEVGVCISDAGVQVCAAELFGDISLSRDEVTARVTDGLDGVAVVGLRDYTTPYASGSARVDGYVVCPCSMSTAASIAAGAMANLVHRAASVALKEERKLVLVPRETPLSTIHLENLLRLRRAGATVVFAAPGFYHAPQTIDDLVNFVVARCLDQLGIDHKLVSRWGQ
jgi:flavin prenyltransferase